MINLVVATYSEAEPLINKLSLKKLTNSKNFDIFFNKKYSLIISGIGKINSALSVAEIFYRLKQDFNNVWINIGIAGHKICQIGKLLAVNKITDYESENAFIHFLKDVNISKENCITFSKPNYNYSNILYDMEASGFFLAANKFSTKELIHSLKIVSDNESLSSQTFNKEEIKELIRANIDEILDFLEIIESTWNNFFLQKNKIEQKIKNDLSKFRKTFSEENQLYSLLKILYNSPLENKDVLDFSSSVKKNIINIKKILEHEH